MIRFTTGIAILIFSLLYGAYQFTSNRTALAEREAALYEALDKRDEGKDLQQRIREIRRISLVNGDAQKFNLERLLEIGAPRLEWRFQGQPLVRGSRALFRYSFRISGPSTAAEASSLLQRMNALPGFVPTRYCLNCSQPPRGTDPSLRMVLIEGFLYAYDPGTLF
jgi:hypothetical protein